MHMGSNERGAYYDKTGKGQRYLSDAVVDEQKNWPTVCASEVRQGFQDRSRGMKGSQESLTTAVIFHGQAAPASSNTSGNRQGLWLTPRANEPDSDPNFAARNADRGAHCHGTLSSQAKETWWTPQVQDSKHSGTNPTANGERDLLVNQVNWMTPRACEAQNPPMGVDKRHHGLTHQVTKQWATPRSGKTTDENPETWALRQAKGDVATMPLGAQVKCWGTPAANDANKQNVMCEVNSKQAGLPKSVGLELQRQWGSPRTGIRADTHFSYDRGKHNIEEQAGASMKGGGKLNPRWVETLMGLPIGWTMPSCTSPQTIAPMSCDSLAMELCRPPQSEPSEFSLAS
jgi:hypothetical protein